MSAGSVAIPPLTRSWRWAADDGESGQALHFAEAPRARRERGPGDCAAAAGVRERPARKLYLQAAQDIRVGGRLANGQYSTPCKATIWRRSGRGHLVSWHGCARSRSSPTSTPISRTAGLSARRHRPRYGRATGRQRRGDRSGAVRRLRAAPGRDAVRGIEPVPRRHGGGAGVLATSRHPQRDVCRQRSGTLIPLSAVARFGLDHRRSPSTISRSSRPSPCRSISGRVPRSAMPSRRSIVRPGTSACRSASTGIPGNSARLSGVARKRAVADRGRARGRVHRARRAL